MHDDNVPGSPTASSDTCGGKGGVVTTTVDLLGRVTSTTDVWGKTTTTTFNQAGQATLVSGVFGDLKTTYTAEAQVDVVQYRATAGSGTYVTLADAAYSTSGQWVGMLDTVAYGNGTSLASLNGASPYGVTPTVRSRSCGSTLRVRLSSRTTWSRVMC